MNAERIARALGGAQKAGRGWLAFCPCHQNTRTPALSLCDGDDGDHLLVYCHAAHCEPRDILAALRQRGLLDDRCDWHDNPLPRPKPKPAATDDAARTEAALRLWHEAREPRSTTVERYFASRGLALDADVAGHVLRYHPSLKHPDGGVWPAMVGLFRDLRTDRPTGIHRTFLAPDGLGKAPVRRPKMMYGPTGGSAIKLDADDYVELGLVVGEGIETCLTARQEGLRPCWALGSAGAIGSLPLLGGVEGLTILTESDANGANACDVQKCVARWHSHADIAFADPRRGKDLNDSLMLLRRSV